MDAIILKVLVHAASLERETYGQNDVPLGFLLFVIQNYILFLSNMVLKNNLQLQVWAEQLLSMYIKWAKKQGYRGRVVEKNLSTNGGIKSATIEFEFEYAYGFLSGERGVHCMIRSSQNGSVHNEVSLLVPFGPVT